ncbi:MAG: pilus assembly protein N-terminal domain-containing protein [Parvibaculum sp.]
MERPNSIGKQLSLLVLAGSLFSMPAYAADINVEISQSHLQKLTRPASTLIVGNPAIADVSIASADTIVILGRTYGQTNLIALDAAGQQIANFDLHVVETQSGSLTVNRGVAQLSYDCSPRCVRTVNPADAQEATDAYISTMATVTSLAETIAGDSGAK